jgi:hypothetical protein
MKKIALLLTCVLLALPASAAFRVYSTLSLTNAANLTNGVQTTVQGSTRTGTNGVPSSTQFALTNRVDLQRTNLYAAFANNPVSGITVNYGTGTNDLVFIGGTNVSVTVSAFGSWASVSNYTSTVFSAAAYITPYVLQSNVYRIWEQNNVVTNLAYANVAIDSTIPAFANFLNLTTNQQAAANKYFTGGNWAGGVSNAWLSPGGTLWLTSGIVRVTSTTQLTNPATAQGWEFNTNTPRSVVRYHDATNIATAVIAPIASELQNGFYLWSYQANYLNETDFYLSDSSDLEHFHININDGFDGATNPDLFSRIGAAETLTSKVLVAPLLLSPEISNATFTAGLNLNSVNVTGAPVLLSEWENMRLLNNTQRITLLPSIGSKELLLFQPTRGGFTPTSILTIGHTAPGATGGRFWDFGLFSENLNEYTVGDQTIARLGDLNNNSDIVATRPTFKGYSTNAGSIIHKSAIVALGSGANLVTRSTNNLIWFTGTNATINAITNAGGVVGDDWFRGVNKSGGNMDIAHLSSATTAPANCQILTPGGVTLTIPNNADFLFTYDAVSGYWRVTSSSFSSVSALTLTGSTNQIIFGSTNTSPTTTATPVKWISAQVTGETNVYRLPLYQ